MRRSQVLDAIIRQHPGLNKTIDEIFHCRIEIIDIHPRPLLVLGPKCYMQGCLLKGFFRDPSADTGRVGFFLCFLLGWSRPVYACSLVEGELGRFGNVV